MIAIVDYGMGNLRSVEKAVVHVGFEARVTSKPQDVFDADKVIFPGVGSFGGAVFELEKRGLIEPLIKIIKDGKMFLGICLGLQLLFEKSEESRGMNGLSVFKGTVDRFVCDFKIPHMGWNQIEIKNKACPILGDVKSETYMYFVHSYYVAPKDNVYATQFHPEKSQSEGLKILKAFCALKE